MLDFCVGICRIVFDTLWWVLFCNRGEDAVVIMVWHFTLHPCLSFTWCAPSGAPGQLVRRRQAVVRGPRCVRGQPLTTGACRQPHATVEMMTRFRPFC